MAFSRVNALGWALFEVLTSAQMNQLDIDHANALDGAAGGPYNPSNPIEVNGVNGIEVETLKVTGTLSTIEGIMTVDQVSGGEFRWQANDYPSLISHTRTYPLPLVVIDADTQYSYGRGLFQRWQSTSNAAQRTIVFDVVKLPFLNQLSALRIFVNSAGNAGFPATLPDIELLRIDHATGGVTSVGTQVDTSADQTAFELYHSITLSGLSETLDGTNSYRLECDSQVDGSGDITWWALEADVVLTEGAPS